MQIIETQDWCNQLSLPPLNEFQMKSLEGANDWFQIAIHFKHHSLSFTFFLTLFTLFPFSWLFNTTHWLTIYFLSLSLSLSLTLVIEIHWIEFRTGSPNYARLIYVLMHCIVLIYICLYTAFCWSVVHWFTVFWQFDKWCNFKT